MKLSRIPDFFRRRQILTASLLCAAGVILNLLLSSVVAALKLPLYLDTVGTVAVAVMGGYLPGVLVGFVTNTVKALSDPSAIYYGVMNVLIAFFAAFLGRRNWHKSIRGLLGMTAIFIFIGGGLGSLIPMFLNGLTFDSEAISIFLTKSLALPPVPSHILSSLIMDFPDKTVTVILSYIILRLIPSGFYKYFRLHLWMQKPVDQKELSRGITGVRIISLHFKMLIILVLSLIAAALVCILISVNVYQRMTVEEHSGLARGTAKLAADVTDGDRISNYLRNRGNDDDYRETKKLLESILFSSTEVSYLYVYRPEEDGFRVVFDIDTGSTPAETVGSLIPYDHGFEPFIPELLAGERIEPIITNDKYGYLLTVAEPVFDSNGKCVCYAIADVDMESINADRQSFLTEMISIFLSFFILLTVFVFWLNEYQILIPINSLVSCMDRISRRSSSPDDLDRDVRLLRNLGIHTGDELENLYLSACSMTKNQSEQMRSIRRLSDSTAKMQDGLIITMADLVESRDSDTGAHVQKTAAYVKIIAEGLREKGYYAEKITPKFISDVVRSAPLHDIGKINIPDEVLNKPGKLDDEEFEIMKTHTTAGKRIIENAISTVEGDNYLKEARNMAAYHHERWDGKGYPEGIHGEVIPLSARIMAVADVFDALTSPRVYKPAFPLEKALSILDEGKGTQFDPKCVEVFMDSLAEVRVILIKYKEKVR